MRRILAVAMLSFALTLPAWAKPASVLLEELRRSFTLDGKPIPPEVFADFGDADMADSASIRVAIDVRAAIGSNLYADEITSDPGGWVSQRKVIGQKLTEETGYRFLGATRNGLLVVIAAWLGGGSGNFFTLHILDAALARAFDINGNLYDRINLTDIRDIPLGDRWDGDANIDGNVITIMTKSGLPGTERKTQRIEAVRP
jgi:hypothetical protein